MSPSSDEAGTLDPRVNRALQEFLERKDRGEAVDHQQFLTQHAEVADQLRSFIFDSDDLSRRAEGPSEAEISTNQSVSETIAPVSPGALPVLPEVFGRYRLKRLLGRGAMGAVYLAQDTQLSRQVALKVPHFDKGESDELLKRFYLEARAAATLRNPHICPVYDVGEINGQHYISMAYIEGHALSEVIGANGAQDPRQALLLIRKLALALQEAHDQGIIHRDLKPGNVMIDKRGEPVVMDFGLACQTREGASRITLSGVILGSPAYMSPEQLEGNAAQITPAADQYALGVILYELLTGQLPFRGSISAVISQIIMKPAPSPRAVRPEIDPRIDALCLKMMSKQANERLESMKAVADCVAAILKEPMKAGSSETAKTSSGPKIAPPAATVPPAKTEPAKKPAARAEPVPAPAPPQTPSGAGTGVQSDRLSSLCVLAAKLIRKHDYAEAIQVLSGVPLDSRSEALIDLLTEAEEKEEESNALLQDIDLAIRRNQPKELSAYVKRFLQLKPANKAIQTLANDLQKYGAERVISVRKKQKNFLDPAGQTWNPVHIAYFVVGLLLFCTMVYLSTIALQTSNGLVIIEVHDPRISVSFANDEITAQTTGKKFRLKATEKKTLELEVDGVVVNSSTQEITVANNETKLITARLVDGKLDLLINSEKKTFRLPGQIGDGDQKKPVAEAPTATVDEWIDMLAKFDLEKVNSKLARWKREDKVLVGTIIPDAELGWVPFVPRQQIRGDYDIEVDYRVVESDYVQIGLPLNDTIVTVSLHAKGTSLHWIDGKDADPENITRPLGSPDVKLQPNVVQHFSASIRHHGENVEISTQLDGQNAGTYAGLRSRVTTPKESAPRPNQLKLVSPFLKKRTDKHRIEIHKARVRFITPPASSAAGEEQWVQLFNGKDLSGWTPMVTSGNDNEIQTEMSGGWVVSDGAIACVDTTPGWLRLDRTYGDGELRFEFFMPPGTNSGLLVHYPGQGAILGLDKCEIQLENDPSQQKPHQKCGGIYGTVPPSKNAFKPGEWNQMSVGLNDGRIAIRLNDQLVVDTRFSEHPNFADLPPKGYFGFLNHNGRTARAKGCKFRNIRFKSSGASPSPTSVAAAPSNPPTVPATTGPATTSNSSNVIIDVDFRKTDGNFAQGDYDFLLAEHKDGEYRYMGKKPGWWFGSQHPATWLKENNQMRDFIMEVDVRLVGRKKGLFGIEFGMSGDNTLTLCLDQNGRVKLLHAGVDIVPPTPSPVMKPVDQFNTLRLTVENKTVKVAVNGVSLFDKKLERYSGGFVSLWLGPEEVPFDARIRRVHYERLGPKPPAWTQEIRRFKGHTGIVRAVAYLPDGQRALSCSHDKTLRMWEVETGKLLHTFNEHTDCVTSLSVSQDGTRALTGCWDSHVRLWDLENRTLLKTLKGHTSRVGSVHISRDGQTGLSVSNDGAIRQWDLKTGRSKLLPGGSVDGVLAVSLAENVVATASGDGTIVVRNAQAFAPLLGHSVGFIEGLTFTPDGTKLVSGADDGTVRVWDLKDGKELYKWETEGVGFDTVAVTNDGKYVLAGSCDHTIVGWELETGKIVGTIFADEPVTHRFALSPDNKYVLSGGGDRAWNPIGDFDLRLWKLVEPKAP